MATLSSLGLLDRSLYKGRSYKGRALARFVQSYYRNIAWWTALNADHDDPDDFKPCVHDAVISVASVYESPISEAHKSQREKLREKEIQAIARYYYNGYVTLDKYGVRIVNADCEQRHRRYCADWEQLNKIREEFDLYRLACSKPTIELSRDICMQIIDASRAQQPNGDIDANLYRRAFKEYGAVWDKYIKET